MTIERQHPPGLHTTPGYHHVTVASPGRTLYLAGQCPLAEDGSVVDGAVLAQTDQVVANTAAALALSREMPG